MKKKIAKFSVLPIVGASVFLYSFTARNSDLETPAIAEQFATRGASVCYWVQPAPADPALDETYRIYPKLERSYLAFKEALGFQESGGDYTVINEFGYMGKYQFGIGTLKMIGIRDTRLFLETPSLQEAAFYANASRNKWILRRDIARFNGKVINGVKITESGILAAAHLAGAGNVKKFLRSWGATTFSDGFGTSIRYYFRKFAGFDTSFVVENRIARVRIPSAI